MEEPGADVLRKSWVVEQERAGEHEPRGSGRAEGAIAVGVGVLRENTRRQEISDPVNVGHQIERRYA